MMSEVSVNSYSFYKALHPESPCVSHSCLCVLLPCSTGTGLLKLVPAAAALIALSGDSPLTKYRGNLWRSLGVSSAVIQISKTLSSSFIPIPMPRGFSLICTQRDGSFQGVGPCFLIIHNLVVLAIYLCGDFSGTQVVIIPLKTGTLLTMPFTNPVVLITDVLNYQEVEM